MRFPTFAECWHENPTAHEFADQERMKTGAFKCCFIGVLGVAPCALPQIMLAIHNYKPELVTQDIVTCIELGMDQRQSLFDFNYNDRVIVVRDVLRKSLINQKGVLKGGFDGGNMIEMSEVLEKQIRQVTKGSFVRVIHTTDALYMHEGTAQQDGGLDGWCEVKIDSKVYTIPTMWIESISTAESRNSTWENKACVKIIHEQIVPEHAPDTCMAFQGDGNVDIIDIIAKFDPDSKITPKIFRAVDISMREWSDQTQKNTVIDSMCQQHARDPSKFFHEEHLVGNTDVHFNWEGCTGTQSIFESGENVIFYVDTTSPRVRAQALIGWSVNARDEIQWELPRHHKAGNTQPILQRDTSLIVVGCRIAHRYDYTRTGRIWELIDSNDWHSPVTTCLVEWDKVSGAYSIPSNIIVEEEIASLERSVLIRKVAIPPSLMWGTIQDYYGHHVPEYVLVEFQSNSSMGVIMRQAWFNLKQLNYRRLWHKLQVFMSYPWRTARFTVQERVGISIESLEYNKCKLEVNTVDALHNLCEAIVCFCHGAALMHRKNITHCDLHPGNITITQSADGESFCIKMIDFDRMKERPVSSQTRYFHIDLLSIVHGLCIVVQGVQCLSQDQNDVHHISSKISRLSCKLTAMQREVASMPSVCSHITTANYLLGTSEKIHSV